MRKILKYHICWHYDLRYLKRDINEFIAEGFEPYGSFMINNEDPDSRTVFIQPMVKYETHTIIQVEE